MKKVLFVCHGNICRSPMAEFVMKDLVEKAGLSAQFEIASAATSTEEIGNPVYPPARRKLAEHGMESTCGALIGAVMVAGAATDGKGTPRISKELLQNFQEKCGATICKDLKGVETGAPLCPCPECVRNAVLALGEVLGE